MEQENILNNSPISMIPQFSLAFKIILEGYFFFVSVILLVLYPDWLMYLILLGGTEFKSCRRPTTFHQISTRTTNLIAIFTLTQKKVCLLVLKINKMLQTLQRKIF